ncbi:MAG: hypothetical protein JW821_16760 [Deltaproteobacteria bacterium]|nr:hypothetical protein [Deltaproteobacteria bacterium]
MSRYIVCHRKRNNPRMDIRICEKKCPVKDECKDFLAGRQISQESTFHSPPREPDAAEREAA